MPDNKHREGSLDAPTRYPIDWKSEKFNDPDDLTKELERVFDVCHTCRRCVSLCESFPRLFDLIDESPTLEVDDTPVSPTTSAGVIAPTLEVKLTPVNGTPIAGTIDPTFVVADTPVSPITSAGEIDPTDDVAATPVIPTTSAGVKAPVEEVILNPFS